MAVNKKKGSRTDQSHDREHETVDGKHLLQSVMDASLTGIAYLRPIHNDSQGIIDFECVFANNKGIEYSGCDEMAGKRYSQLFPGITTTEIFRNYIKAFEENSIQDFEVHNNEKSDNWFRITAVKVGNGVVVSSEDITTRKKVEKELAAQHNLLKQAEELAQAGSWEYDITTKKFIWSDGMYLLFNMIKGSHVIPGVYLDYAIEEDLPVAQRIVDAIGKNFQPFEEVLRIRSNGIIKTLKIKAAPLKDDKEQIETMLGVDVDISGAQQSEQKIVELNKSLFMMNKELNFLNRELKNFNRITATNYSEALRHIYINLEAIVTTDARNLSDSSRANLRRAQSSIQRLKLLTNDINNYLHLYDIGINKEMINPNKILENVLSTMNGKIEDAQATITTTELPRFEADPLLFSYLMTNLIDNAIKFRKLAEPIIKVHYSRANGLDEIPNAVNNTTYVIIIISDNGIGFPYEEMDRMFELFYQLPTDGRHRGSGMGLAICKKIMEMHGGFITAEGQLAVGASFQCYFPV